MFLHAIRFAAAFGTILIAFWAYTLIAVPLIEPGVVIATGRDASLGGRSTRIEGREEEFRRLFRPGSWELESPMVIETAQGHLLFKEYKPLEKGRMEIKPCTLVFHTSGGQPEGRKRPIVMQAPDRALLQFDRDFDLGSGEIGRLIGGRLVGDVNIFSAETAPGEEDDLDISTRNVHLAEDHVMTPHDVKFRFGRNHGSGRDLKITLIPGPPASDDSTGPMYEGVRDLELVHVDKIHLYMKGKGLLGDEETEEPAAAVEQKPPTPVEITCQGPFRFDFEKNVAAFNDRVEVERKIPDEPSDTLQNCYRLECHFSRREADAESGTAAADTAGDEKHAVPIGGMKIERMVALGKPAVLTSPSRQAVVQAERLEYEINNRQFFLKDSRRLFLRDARNYVELDNRLLPGPPPRNEPVQLRYEMAPEGRLGRLWATGPGRYQGLLGEEQDRRAEAAWQQQLLLRPDGDSHAFSILGKAHAHLAENGTFDADEIHVWLDEIEQPRQPAPAADGQGKAKPKFEIVPNRLLATGNVNIDSKQLSGNPKKLEAWFRRAAPVAAAPLPPSAEAAAGPSNSTAEQQWPGTGNSAVASTSTTAAPLARPSLLSRDPAPTEAKRQQKFDIQGDSLRVQLCYCTTRAKIRKSSMWPSMATCVSWKR